MTIDDVLEEITFMPAGSKLSFESQEFAGWYFQQHPGKYEEYTDYEKLVYDQYKEGLKNV